MCGRGAGAGMVKWSDRGKGAEVKRKEREGKVRQGKGCLERRRRRNRRNICFNILLINTQPGDPPFSSFLKE